MADDKRKALLVLGIPAVLGGIWAWRALKPKPELPEEVAASISIEILGAQYNSLPSVNEDSIYTVRVSVFNRSTKAGALWPANLDVSIVATANGVVLMPFKRKTEAFTAGQTRTFDYGMVVPLGTGGKTGKITAQVWIPATSTALGTVSDVFNIIAVSIVYSATITIMV